MVQFRLSFADFKLKLCGANNLSHTIPEESKIKFAMGRVCDSSQSRQCAVPKTESYGEMLIRSTYGRGVGWNRLENMLGGESRREASGVKMNEIAE